MTTNLLARFEGMQLDATTLRVGGPDRYATAVELSKHAFPDALGPVPIAYLATGANFPDALAAAAATRGAGPVLLVPGSTIPQVVLDELRRLRPAELVVVGGGAVVSDARDGGGLGGGRGDRRAGFGRRPLCDRREPVARNVRPPALPWRTSPRALDFPGRTRRGCGRGAARRTRAADGPRRASRRHDRPSSNGSSRSGSWWSAAPSVVSGGILNRLAGLAPHVGAAQRANRYETAFSIARDLGESVEHAHRRVGHRRSASPTRSPPGRPWQPRRVAALWSAQRRRPRSPRSSCGRIPQEVLVAGLTGAVPAGVVAQVPGPLRPVIGGHTAPADAPIADARRPRYPRHHVADAGSRRIPQGAELPWLELPPATGSTTRGR